MFGKKRKRRESLHKLLAYAISIKDEEPYYSRGICGMIPMLNIPIKESSEFLIWFRKQRPAQFKYSKFYAPSQKGSGWWWNNLDITNKQVRIAFIEHLIYVNRDFKLFK